MIIVHIKNLICQATLNALTCTCLLLKKFTVASTGKVTPHHTNAVQLFSRIHNNKKACSIMKLMAGKKSCVAAVGEKRLLDGGAECGAWICISVCVHKKITTMKEKHK